MNKLSKFLLASTCLTAVNVATAQAVTVFEVEINDGSINAQNLAANTTQVIGNLGTDDLDTYKLTGLPSGGTFSAFISSSDSASFTEQAFVATNSSLSLLTFQPSVADGTSLGGTIPNDGILFLSLSAFITEGAPYDYTLNLNFIPPETPAPRVPEPSVVNLMASGVAGLTALRALWRKRQTS